MASLLQTSLANAIERRETMSKQNRQDTIAVIVLDRIEREINALTKKVTNEQQRR